jgi:hydrogenase expression/formation protein HypC
MQVTATEPGHARCAWRGETRRVRTALTGELQVGDWVLVFLDSAQERISPERAAEVDAALAMLAAANTGQAFDADGAFALPSQMSHEQLMALSGRTLETP